MSAAGTDQCLCRDTLSLPAPTEVNAFFAQNQTKWRDPLLLSFPSLQVTLCRSSITGPSYDFYELAHEGGCKSRPPKIQKAEGAYNPWEKFILWEIAVLPWLLVVWLVIFCIGAQYLYEEGMKLRVGHHAEAMTSVMDSKGWPLVMYLLTTIAMFVFTCFNLNYILEVKTSLPVSLPDPDASGLNQFLFSSNLTLYRCHPKLFDFYVGFPDSCSQLGDPYAGLSSRLLQKIADTRCGSLDANPNDTGRPEAMGLAAFFWLLFGSLFAAGTLPIAILDCVRVVWYYRRLILEKREDAARCHPVEGKEELETGL